MTYNPEIHHRRSIRIPNYDYSQPGAYFVTICVQDKQCLFGEIIDDGLHLSHAGRMVEKWWNELSHKFLLELDIHVIMPNHMHGILVLTSEGPGPNPRPPGAHIGAPLQVSHTADAAGQLIHHHPMGAHTGAPLHNEQSDGPSISEIIKWFKTMTTNEYIRGVKQHGWPRFDGNLWQRNYYEHVIRNEKSLDEIRQYIENNPALWALDEDNPANTRP